MSDSSTAEARPGYELPILLLLGFRRLIDELHAELAAAGHPEARPMHGFVCQAIGADGATAVTLGRRLGISKQAAGKLVATLEAQGYVARAPDTADARRRPATLTPRGRDLLARSALIFDRLRADWAALIGAERVSAMEDDLRTVTAGAAGGLLDMPGWFARG